MPGPRPRRSCPGTGATEHASVLSPGASAPSTSCCARQPSPTATAPSQAVSPSYPYPYPSPLSPLPVLTICLPDCSRPICRFHLGFGLEGVSQGREAAAQPAAPALPAQTAEHRRTGLRATVPHWRGTALRGIQPTLRPGLHLGNHQPVTEGHDGNALARAASGGRPEQLSVTIRIGIRFTNWALPHPPTWPCGSRREAR